MQVGAGKFSIGEIGAREAVIVATVYRSDHNQILTLVMKVAQVRGISRSETLSRLSKAGLNDVPLFVICSANRVFVSKLSSALGLSKKSLLRVGHNPTTSR